MPKFYRYLRAISTWVKTFRIYLTDPVLYADERDLILQPHAYALKHAQQRLLPVPAVHEHPHRHHMHICPHSLIALILFVVVEETVGTVAASIDANLGLLWKKEKKRERRRKDTQGGSTSNIPPKPPLWLPIRKLPAKMTSPAAIGRNSGFGDGVEKEVIIEAKAGDRKKFPFRKWLCPPSLLVRTGSR